MAPPLARMCRSDPHPLPPATWCLRTWTCHLIIPKAGPTYFPPRLGYLDPCHWSQKRAIFPFKTYSSIRQGEYGEFPDDWFEQKSILPALRSQVRLGRRWRNPLVIGCGGEQQSILPALRSQVRLGAAAPVVARQRETFSCR